ncbi:glycosyltransferase family 39 protein, partial [Candidatus Omnitrophota bacterium]
MKPANKLINKLSAIYTGKALLWAIIGLGILFRAIRYLYNSSLCRDEATLALNLVNRSFSGLLQPLDPLQVAPTGFLMVERFLIQTLGASDYVLRLFPFICGLISLFLFYKVARHFSRQLTLPISLCLFSVCCWLIHYGSKVKPYSSDVTIALLLLLITVYLQSRKLTAGRIAMFGIAGAVSIWLSFTSIFVLAGMGSSLLIFGLADKDWRRIGRLSILYLIWLISFILFYIVCLNNLSRNDILPGLISNRLVPFPPKSFSDAKWLVEKFFYVFINPGGLFMPGLAAFAFLAGCASMFIENWRKPVLLLS